MSWQQRFRQALDQRRAADGWRQRRIVDEQTTRTLHSGGRCYHHFSSNDYLGLTRHPAVIAAWQQGAALTGAGAGGLRTRNRLSPSACRSGGAAGRLARL